MAQQEINIGTAPNDGTGDSARVAGQKINENFTEVYSDILQIPESADQTEVNEGIIEDKFVSPATLNNWGTSGPGGQTVLFTWKFSTNINVADPGNGNFRGNNVSYLSITELCFNDITSSNQIDISNFYTRAKGNWLLHIQQRNNASKWVQYNALAPFIDNTGWWIVPVTFAEVGSGVALANGIECLITFVNMNETPEPVDASEIIKGVVEIATQEETDAGTDDTRVITPLKAALTFATKSSVIGVQDLFMPAAGMWPRSSNGCAPLAKVEIAGSLINILTLDFDQSIQQYAQFSLSFPRNWNNGNIKARFEWSAAAGSGDVMWDIKAVALSDGDPLSTPFGTAQSVIDTFSLVNSFQKTSETPDIVIANSPNDLDTIYFEVSRVASNVADTLTAPARLKGVFLSIVTDSSKAE